MIPRGGLGRRHAAIAAILLVGCTSTREFVAQTPAASPTTTANTTPTATTTAPPTTTILNMQTRVVGTIPPTTPPPTDPPTTITTIPETTATAPLAVSVVAEPPTTTAAPQATTATSTTSTTSTTSAPPATQPAPSPAFPAEGYHIGSIEIPRIGLNQPLFEGVSVSTLNQGPGHWPGTALPGQVGNTVVGGHRTSKTRPFRYLDKLVAGDEVIFTTDAGRFVYRVIRTEIHTPDATWIVTQPNASIATLFACHPVGSTSHRIVVFLELVV